MDSRSKALDQLLDDQDVVMHTRSKYIEAFERLTTIPFPAYRENPSVVLG